MASVRNGSEGGQRTADTLLRATGGMTATLMVAPAQGDTTDAGQIGLDAPGFQAVALQPVSFRRTRPLMMEGKAARYELLVSASAVEQLVGLLQLDSAETLFAITAALAVAGLNFEIESWSGTMQLGQVVLYRLLLRGAVALGQTAQN